MIIANRKDQVTKLKPSCNNFELVKSISHISYFQEISEMPVMTLLLTSWTIRKFPNIVVRYAGDASLSRAFSIVNITLLPQYLENDNQNSEE
jgi:hypothetical protein